MTVIIMLTLYCVYWVISVLAPWCCRTWGFYYHLLSGFYNLTFVTFLGCPKCQNIHSIRVFPSLDLLPSCSDIGVSFQEGQQSYNFSLFTLSRGCTLYLWFCAMSHLARVIVLQNSRRPGSVCQYLSRKGESNHYTFILSKTLFSSRHLLPWQYAKANTLISASSSSVASVRILSIDSFTFFLLIMFSPSCTFRTLSIHIAKL